MMSDALRPKGHPQLKPNWAFPDMPEGFDRAFVVLGRSGNVKLDFLSDKRKVGSRPMIYSLDVQSPVPKCEWPWKSDYLPSQEDWESLGFGVSRMFDNCFGSPSHNYMFTDWTGK